MKTWTIDFQFNNECWPLTDGKKEGWSNVTHSDGTKERHRAVVTVKDGQIVSIQRQMIKRDNPA